MEINLYEPFIAMFDSSKRLYWLYILSSLIIATLYLFVHKQERVLNLSTKVWFHKSAILDYRYFILSFFIKTLIIVPLVFGVNEVTIVVYEYLEDSFGYLHVRTFSQIEVTIMFTLSLFIVSDFTRYWLHRVLHVVPFLWEFHKVHHSAEVLTPITFYRVHPVENLLFGFRYALSIGLVTGVFIYVFGAMVDIYDILGANIILFIFSLAGSNLRHSHIKVTYSHFLEHIFISPFAHQIHHSTTHYNRNFGGYLAIWDTIFFTLQSSKELKSSDLKYGVNREDFTTISKLLFTPFKNIYKGKK